MSFLWDSVYRVFTRTRNYLVDAPGEVNPENPENPITVERRDATHAQLGKLRFRHSRSAPSMKHLVRSRSAADVADHRYQEADVEPEECETNQCAG